VDQLVAERYQLLDRIGSGGAAVVYRARDTRLDRTVAVKLLRDDHAADRDFLTRFEREARIAAGLNHSNIVPVYDYGPHGATAFIAMQHIEGGNLKDALRARGPFEPRAAIEIAEQVLSALAAAHARGLVHRDVKPQNVLLTGEGRAMLTDFGIAQASTAGELTQVGTTIGSAAYMAPEQALGRPVGPATDIYGVGLLLYELLTGQPPFGTGTPVEVAFRQVNEVPRPPGELRSGIPQALESIVMKALEKDPAARFESAPAMLAALESVPLVAAGDETARMQTVRMPRVEAAYNATARAPPTAPVSAGRPAHRLPRRTRPAAAADARGRAVPDRAWRGHPRPGRPAVSGGYADGSPDRDRAAAVRDRDRRAPDRDAFAPDRDRSLDRDRAAERDRGPGDRDAEPEAGRDCDRGRPDADAAAAEAGPDHPAAAAPAEPDRRAAGRRGAARGHRLPGRVPRPGRLRLPGTNRDLGLRLAHPLQPNDGPFRPAGQPARGAGLDRRARLRGRSPDADRDPRQRPRDLPRPGPVPRRPAEADRCALDRAPLPRPGGRPAPGPEHAHDPEPRAERPCRPAAVPGGRPGGRPLPGLTCAASPSAT
jgi:serine/threonine protein kinase